MRLVFRWLVSVLCVAAVALRASPAVAQSPDQGPRMTIIRDAETETLLRNIANPLFRAAGIDPNMVRIVILQDDAINAFVSTGNRLFINSGLIRRAESASELVGVIAHEAGHIRGGHLAKLPEMMREAMIQSMAGLLVGAVAGIGARSATGAIGSVMGAQQLAQRNFLSFTRGMEQSADQSAIYTLNKVHWSARGMLTMFERMESQESMLSEQQDPYLQTHPLTRDRIAFIRQAVKDSQWSNAPLPDGMEFAFRMMRAKLEAFLFPSSVTLGRVRADDPAPTARYARSVALYRLGHTDDATRLLDGLLREFPSNPWLYEMKGQVLFEGGRGRAAIPPYQDAVRLAPGQALIRGELGRAMIETGDPAMLKPAVDQLLAATSREPDEADNWRALGIAYGKLGDIPNADLALAEEAMLNGDLRNARFLAGRAAKGLKPGPAQQRALDISNAVKKENRQGF